MSGAGAQEVEYAGLGLRSLAFFLDALVWLVLLSQIAGNIPQSVYEDEPVVVGVIFLVLFSLGFNYFWLTEWKWGKTLGKAICSIRVRTENGGDLRFGPSTVRNLLRLVDVIVIGPILIASSDRRQRLGDRAAHSVVVRDRPTPLAVSHPHPTPPVAANPATAATVAAPAPTPPQQPPVGKASPWARSIGIPEAGFRPLTVLWGILVLIGLLTVETVVVAGFDPKLESLGAKLAVQGFLAVTLIAVALGFAGWRRSPRSALNGLGVRGFAGSALGLAAVAYIAYIVFAAVYSLLVQPEQEDLTKDLGFDDGGVGPIIAGFLIVALAPLSEEIFFRGFMYGGLRRRLPVWGAAAISGLVFGLLHYTGPDSIGVVPQLAVLGVLLAWLYERTGSLWPPIMLHVVNNGIALAIVTST